MTHPSLTARITVCTLILFKLLRLIADHLLKNAPQGRPLLELASYLSIEIKEMSLILNNSMQFSSAQLDLECLTLIKPPQCPLRFNFAFLSLERVELADLLDFQRGLKAVTILNQPH